MYNKVRAKKPHTEAWSGYGHIKKLKVYSVVDKRVGWQTNTRAGFLSCVSLPNSG